MQLKTVKTIEVLKNDTELLRAGSGWLWGRCCAGYWWILADKSESVFPVVCLQVVGVSAVTGSGLDELFVQVQDAAEEYER